METNTAKNFALQLGSLISLYLSLSFIVVLLFAVIDIKFPDGIDNYWSNESAFSSIRLGVAMLVVFFPAYLILTRYVNKIRRTETSGSYLVLMKWLIYLSLLIGGGVLLGDLVTVINAFLNGEITSRFILKATTVFVLTGLAFYYYILDARGYWLTHERKSVYYASVVSFLVLASVVLGVMNVATPAKVREMKLDVKQVEDLTYVQSVLYPKIQADEALPKDIFKDLEDNLGRKIEAPAGREPYTYEVTPLGFKLCATFAENSADYQNDYYVENSDLKIRDPYNWSYKMGRYCFNREITKKTPQNAPFVPSNSPIIID